MTNNILSILCILLKIIYLIFISFSVFIFINLIENLIHYNIGRNHNNELNINLPSKKIE